MSTHPRQSEPPAFNSAAAEMERARIRCDFPILAQRVHGRPLVYLDNAATTQKPLSVMRAVQNYYAVCCSNVHRGVHQLSARATEQFEGARAKIAKFIGAASSREIVYTRGTTESINLVAHSFGALRIGAGDEVIITEMEHHSNIVPWQLLAERNRAHLRVVPLNDDGDLRLDEFERLLGPRTRLVSVVHTSNALGTRNPVEQIIRLAHANGTPVLVDAAQAVAHEPIDVQGLDCDFLAFSGHKVFGPTGIGVLYGKMEHLEAMPPFLGGGEMIRTVSFERTTYKGPPQRFEAGTPDIAGAIGLGTALDYLSDLGVERVAAIDADLLDYAVRHLAEIEAVRLIGTSRDRRAVISFTVAGVHPHDVGTVLDLQGVAVRAGHHCAQPVMERFRVPATVRASFAMYNTRDEVDALISGIHRAIEVFS